ncbi:MAG: oxidoreductase [Stenotrophobium sp.]
MPKWTQDSIPDQSGKTALVTGANSGLGLATAQMLAAKGAHVVLACRGPAKAEHAMTQIHAAVHGAKLEFLQLDLSNLSSVRAAAESFKSRHARLDLLCNNAGVMGHTEVQRTRDGFEMQFGTNHLGHFALTGLLLDTLKATDSARVVSVSSIGHKAATGLNLDDPGYEHTPYTHFEAYGRSKLANLLFAFEMDRRLKAAHSGIKSCAAHPGYSSTNITSGTNQSGNWLKTFAVWLGNALLGMPPEKGALPTLYAATAPEIKGGEFIGPNGLFQLWGWPAPVKASPLTHDAALAAALWKRSEELTGVKFL